MNYLIRAIVLSLGKGHGLKGFPDAINAVYPQAIPAVYRAHGTQLDEVCTLERLQSSGDRSQRNLPVNHRRSSTPGFRSVR